MTKTLTLLTAAAALSFGAANKQTFTGVITDDMCGANHAAMKVSPEEKCVRECVKHGSKYALLVGDKVYKLSNQKAPEPFAAKKVTVTGTLHEKTNIIAVDSIEAAR